MGLDYALVHVVYTIPPALALTVLLYPLLTRRDLSKICFLLFIAVVYTIPWDSHLIRTNVWSYPPEAVLGPTLFRIPVEELFFFVIQTYTTSLLYILLNKSTPHAIYLLDDSDGADIDVAKLQSRKRLGQVFLAFNIVAPFFIEDQDQLQRLTYFRLILNWALPVILLLWTLSYQLILKLSPTKVWLPIAIPTLYLWIVDTIALRRGTWSIESGTKLGVNLWPGLEIEEAVFFLATNVLVVFGLVAYDNALAVLDIFPHLYPKVPENPSPILLVKALLTPTASYDSVRLTGIRNALTTLAKKSRSFYLASGVFSGRLRIDLILLYAFCRVADDLVDNAATPIDAEKWISHLSQFLDVAYALESTNEQKEAALECFSPEDRSILALLPVDRLPALPLYNMLDGFRTDLKFTAQKSVAPVRTEADLELYASRVASTVSELCLHLVYFHDPHPGRTKASSKQHCIAAGGRMGLALQYINIARDVITDAEIGRCYVPSEWFQDPPPTTAEGFQAEILSQRQRMLKLAFELYGENRAAIEDLPAYARGGIRVAVESYVEIGRVIKEKIRRGEPLDLAGGGKGGRASVPRLRRLKVGWLALAGSGSSAPTTATEKQPENQKSKVK